MESTSTLSDRLEAVRARIRSACERAGRAGDTVELVAVSKNHPPSAVDEAARCGQRIFGENRVQEAAMKMEQCSGALEWHLVGHLQSNKARLAVELFSMIHSVDSAALLQTLNRHAGEAGRKIRVLIEVNIAGEASKFGVAPAALPALLELAQELPRVEVAGLMGMPPFYEDAALARPDFARLRELRDRMRSGTGWSLDVLSMGMSHDLESAILEGSTLVRVGTDIFGPRPKGAWKPVNGDFEP